MRLMHRNKRTIWYCQYLGEEPVVDDALNETGEYRVVYSEPAPLFAVVSPASGYVRAGVSGYAHEEPYGTMVDYDKVILTEDMSCPINENSVLFLDKEPEFSEDGTPLYDYLVRRVAKALTNISIATAKVTVS